MFVRIVSAAASVFVAALVMAPAPASGGGFSTVGLTSPPPERIEARQAWEARFTVLAHGRTPLEHLEPVVRIEQTDGGGARTFRATKTGEPGTYRTRVVFPAEGRWAIEVAEHESMAGSPVAGHSFGTLDIGTPAASANASSADRGPSVLPALAIAVALGLLGGGGAWLLQARLAPRRSVADGG